MTIKMNEENKEKFTHGNFVLLVNIEYFLFFIFLLIPNYIFADSTHLQKLNSKYPYALIGNDYELLSEEDLALNGCEALPSPFSLTSTSYPYWQCFETKNTKLFCDGHDYD